METDHQTSSYSSKAHYAARYLLMLSILPGSICQLPCLGEGLVAVGMSLALFAEVSMFTGVVELRWGQSGGS
jgi:hypothetical protein